MTDSDHSDDTAVNSSPRQHTRRPRRRPQPTLAKGPLHAAYSLVHALVYAPVAWITFAFYLVYQELIRFVFASVRFPRVFRLKSHRSPSSTWTDSAARTSRATSHTDGLRSSVPG